MPTRVLATVAILTATGAGCLIGVPSASARPAPAPAAILSANCAHGLVAVLSNLNGKRPVTFHVTGPRGHTSLVRVRPDQAKRRFFVVRPGHTGTLHVRAAGMATKTKRWTNSCPL